MCTAVDIYAMLGVRADMALAFDCYPTGTKYGMANEWIIRQALVLPISC